VARGVPDLVDVVRPEALLAAGEAPRRRLGGAAVAGSYVVVCVMLFFFFWPVYTAQVIPYAEWAQRMWFPSWI
jgi:dolichyl-phosphate-mannose--protein O-mannosyl transferase